MTTQGKERNKKMIIPRGEKSLNTSRHRFEIKSHIMIIAAGKTIPINPFVKKASALDR
jgi:hypothetical protein